MLSFYTTSLLGLQGQSANIESKFRHYKEARSKIGTLKRCLSKFLLVPFLKCFLWTGKHTLLYYFYWFFYLLFWSSWRVQFMEVLPHLSCILCRFLEVDRVTAMWSSWKYFVFWALTCLLNWRVIVKKKLVCRLLTALFANVSTDLGDVKVKDDYFVQLLFEKISKDFVSSLLQDCVATAIPIGTDDEKRLEELLPELEKFFNFLRV